MNRDDVESPLPREGPAAELPALAGLSATDAPAGFALRVLQRTGIPPQRYDTYVRMESAAGGLYVAFGPQAVTGAALAVAELRPQAFEELHRSRTGRSAIPALKPFRGLRTALRTGRGKHLPLSLPMLSQRERAVLDAVREIPPGQLRPVTWLARESDQDVTDVVEALSRNPLPVLIPCHRATYDSGTPCDVGYPSGVGAALRKAEGIDMQEVQEFARSGALFLGSDTTGIYCHPTCAHARRITAPHRVSFRTAHDARSAGYRACKTCRPITA